MSRRTRTLGLRTGFIGVAVGLTALLGSAPMAYSDARDKPVTGWVRDNATALDSVEPTGPLNDLRALRRSVDDAFVVGLGESVHGAAEETELKHRVLRLLVERMGFRTVAWEEDWTTGLLIDRYIRTGEGDLGQLMSRMSDLVPDPRGGRRAALAAELQRRARGQRAVRGRRVLLHATLRV